MLCCFGNLCLHSRRTCVFDHLRALHFCLRLTRQRHQHQHQHQRQRQHESQTECLNFAQKKIQKPKAKVLCGAGKDEVMTTTSCLEEGEEMDGILESERCADDGPFHGRFLLQELIFAQCEFLPRLTIRRNLMDRADWCALRGLAGCECALLPIVEITGL